MQHNSPDPPNQEHDSFAALRQDFPKAAVAAKPNSQIPSLSFAAFLPDVSVAGQGRSRCRGNWRFFAGVTPRL
jgi:hypothetical protein